MQPGSTTRGDWRRGRRDGELVVTRVHDAVKQTLDDPQVRARIDDTGSTIIGNTPEQFAEQIRAEYDTFKNLAVAQKLRPE